MTPHHSTWIPAQWVKTRCTAWNDAGMADLCIGTAQWGSDYGVTNTTGRLSDDAVRSIMETALAAGVRAVDTAASYGNAQRRLRPWASECSITSKISGEEPSRIPLLIEDCLEELSVPSIEAILIHDWDALSPRSRMDAAGALGVAQQAGQILRCGVSVYGETGIAAAREAFAATSVGLGALQVPANVLDRRLDHAPELIAAVSEGARIQVRSVYLQGLLAARTATGLGQHPDVVRYHDWVSDQADSPSAIALNHLLALPWVHEVVIGVTTTAELKQAIETVRANKASLAPTELASHDLDLVDPRRWKTCE